MYWLKRPALQRNLCATWHTASSKPSLQPLFRIATKLDVSLDYLTGGTTLKSVLSADDVEKLDKYEHICSKLWEYSSRYGFIAGLFCGFEQYFTEGQNANGGFLKTVRNEIDMMPQMVQHKEYHENIKQRNTLACAIEASTDSTQQYHFISVQCAWDNDPIAPRWNCTS